MIHNNKHVIVSKLNSDSIRVYIPEKMRISGNLFVRKYTFEKTIASARPFSILIGSSGLIDVTIKHYSITISSAFSKKLLQAYINAANAANKGKDYRVIKIGKAKRNEQWDQDFLSGKADIELQ